MPGDPEDAHEAITLLQGDCRDLMATLPPNSIDAIVTDPPYGLEFMGVAWDTMRDNGKPRTRNEWKDFGSREHARHPSEVARIHRNKGVALQEFCESWAREAYRVLKPGGYLLAFGGSRTYHRLACAIEDAGFEIRDQLQWLYGSGFPKSLDVSKAMDKAAGAERRVVGTNPNWRAAMANAGGTVLANRGPGEQVRTEPATELSQRWAGWGTALKPSHEPIVLARKPLIGTVAANVATHGTGAINVDGCRVEGGERSLRTSDRRNGNQVYGDGLQGSRAIGETSLGRWPANVILDSDAAALLDAQSGERKAGGKVTGRQQSRTGQSGIYGHYEAKENSPYYDTGGASRFFYCAKASRAERNAGLAGMPESLRGTMNDYAKPSEGRTAPKATGGPQGNHHPTVKPVALMRWLVRLITPPGGTVLDPFLGSGTTGIASATEGFRFIGIEQDAEYLEIARRRIAHWTKAPDLGPLFAQAAD